MNEIIKAMEERRSIRKFKPDMPTKEDLEQIIEAGLYAANAQLFELPPRGPVYRCLAHGL